MNRWNTRLPISNAAATLFGRTSTGIGIGALGIAAESEEAAAPPADAILTGGLPGLAAFRTQGEAGHLPAPIRRPLANRSLRLQAGSRTGSHGTELPDSVRMGQRITGMTSGQNIASRCAFDFQVPAIRAVRGLGQRAAAAHGQDRRRSSRRSRPSTPTPSITIRRSPSSRRAASSPAGQAWAPGSATAWAARTRICRRLSF